MGEENNTVTAVATQAKANMSIGRTGIELTTLDELGRFADCIIKSGMAPKDCKSKEQAIIAIQMGLEVGLKPMQALHSVAVVNNRPSLWGDAVPGICMGSGLVEFDKEEWVGEKGKDTFGCKYTVKRRNSEAKSATFTIEDAKKAGLWGGNVWGKYPNRMLMNRARTFAFRDAFPDLLKGIPVSEFERSMASEIEEVPITITSPDGTQTQTKAMGVQAVRDRIAKAKQDGKATTPAKATESPKETVIDIQPTLTLSDDEKTAIEARDAQEAAEASR